MKILVTGDGFVGSALTEQLSFIHKCETINAVRTKKKERKNVLTLEVGDVYETLNWSPFLQGVNVVIHTIARVHVMSEQTSASYFEYRRMNVEVMLNLARQAAESGVERFIFISSIKVNGEQTLLGKPFTSNECNMPSDPYGLSKHEAEKGLLEIARNSDMEVVIIRPPIVYGPGVKANFASLISIVKKCVPLPFGSVHNKRSMIAVDNLVDFISLCADRERSPKAANQVFVISDDQDVSTTELLRKIAKAYGKKQWLIPVPVSWMKFVAKLLGRSEQADRLFGNLQVDCSKAKELLGWKPFITMDEQLKKMADAEK